MCRNHVDFTRQKLFSAPLDSANPNSTTFTEFLIRAIERMKPSILRNSLHGSNVEKTWQM